MRIIKRKIRMVVLNTEEVLVILVIILNVYFVIVRFFCKVEYMSVYTCPVTLMLFGRSFVFVMCYVKLHSLQS